MTVTALGNGDFLSSIIAFQDHCCTGSSLLSRCHSTVCDFTHTKFVQLLVGLRSLQTGRQRTNQFLPESHLCSLPCGHPQHGDLLPGSQQRRSPSKTHTATLHNITTALMSVWRILVIPVLGRLRQEACDFQASLTAKCDSVSKTPARAGELLGG